MPAACSATPVCTVPRGSVHAFTERTLRATVFERTAQGETRVHQITDVTCDLRRVDVYARRVSGDRGV